jgi:hypothetical protein
LIFGKLAAVLGDRLRLIMSGGAPLNYFLIQVDFWEACAVQGGWLRLLIQAVRPLIIS